MQNERQRYLNVVFYSARGVALIFCLVLPPSGIVNEVQQSGAKEGVETRKK